MSTNILVLCAVAFVVPGTLLAEDTCFVDVRVYNALGHPVDHSVGSVHLMEGERRVRELWPSRVQGGDGTAWTRGQIVFSKKMLDKVIEISVLVGGRYGFSRLIELRDCHERASFQFGGRETGGGHGGSNVSGVVSGCSLKGDWWVRLVPMFDNYWVPVIDEGPIDQHSGRFSFRTGSWGHRHVLIIGKGRDVIKAVGVDLVKGSDNDVGRVDVQQECKK